MLAIDIGRKRHGLAVTDRERRFVVGRDTIECTTPEADLAAIKRVVAEDAIRMVVVGLPLNVDGTEGGSAQAARAFGAALTTALALPVAFVDERYTSIEADEALRERFKDWRERKKRVDRGAATLILRTFLDHGPVKDTPNASSSAGSASPGAPPAG